MTITLSKCNPFVRIAEFQHAILEGESLRLAYDYRLFCVLQNSGVLILDDAEYSIAKGTVICLPPACGYCFRGRMRVAVLNFDVTRAFDQKPKPICPSPISAFDPARVFDMTLVEGLDKPLIIQNGEFLTPGIIDIVTAFKSAGEYADAQTSALLKSVLIKILRHNDTTSRPESRLASKIEGYIKMYAADIKGNDDIARHFGYHPVYIASVFKNETGKTLHTAITEERINIACRFLTQTNIPIDDVANSTGFSSRSHFCTVFKNRLGTSPGEWRRSTQVDTLTV